MKGDGRAAKCIEELWEKIDELECTLDEYYSPDHVSEIRGELEYDLENLQRDYQTLDEEKDTFEEERDEYRDHAEALAGHLAKTCTECDEVGCHVECQSYAWEE